MWKLNTASQEATTTPKKQPAKEQVDTIGSYLRHKREEQNLTIEEMANETRLKAYIIEQIERDDFDAIEDVGFIKIMVITYCRALNGDEGWLQRKISTQIDKETEPPIKINTAKNVKPVILPNNLIWFVCLALLIAILALAFAHLNNRGIIDFSFRDQFASAKQTATPDTTEVEEAPIDEIFSAHTAIFDEAHNIENNTAENTEPTTPSVPVVNRTQRGRNREVIPIEPIHRLYREDKTDHVSNLIFDDIKSPLNPDL